MLKQEARLGLTLIETVIGLGIFCLLTTISLHNLKDYQAKLEEKQALEWFKDTFKGVYNRAYLTHQGSKMIIENKNTIVFDITQNGENGDKVVRRKIPSTMTVFDNSSGQHMIYGTGKSSAAKITFSSSLTNKKYIYKIQMGWGEIIEEKT